MREAIAKSDKWILTATGQKMPRVIKRLADPWLAVALHGATTGAASSARDVAVVAALMAAAYLKRAARPARL